MPLVSGPLTNVKTSSRKKETLAFVLLAGGLLVTCGEGFVSFAGSDTGLYYVAQAGFEIAS